MTDNALASADLLLRDALLQFLREAFALPAAAVTSGAPLFSSGLLDSHCMIELVVFLEEQTGLRPGWADLSLDSFDSVDRIVAWAARKRAKAQ